MVEYRTVKHLEGGAGRILEGDHLFHTTGLGLVGGELFERHAGTVEGCLDSLQCGVIAHLPTDGEHPVGIPGHDDHACRTFIHPQV